MVYDAGRYAARTRRTGALRDNLDEQIERMLSDEKAETLAENFVGQWLQSRDIPLIGLNEREILRGDGILDRRFRLSGSVRRAMQEETEMSFQYLLDNNLSLLELLDADYTFLNKELADFYTIKGVNHSDMRKVQLRRQLSRRNFDPSDHPRGHLKSHQDFTRQARAVHSRKYSWDTRPSCTARRARARGSRKGIR